MTATTATFTRASQPPARNSRRLSPEVELVVTPRSAGARLGAGAGPLVGDAGDLSRSDLDAAPEIEGPLRPPRSAALPEATHVLEQRGRVPGRVGHAVERQDRAELAPDPHLQRLDAELLELRV